MSGKKPQSDVHENMQDNTEQAQANAAASESATLEADLRAARAMAKENEDKFLRAKAETENIRRRAEIDVANAHKYGTERLVSELLPVRDSLELARSVDLAQGTQVVEKVKEGLDLTLRLMDTVFQKFAIALVEPAKGDKFDPEKHQAMSMVETDEVPANHVVQVMQKGYLLNNRLLRPAMVIVAKAK
jgi:molecular chaperone GrpE